MVTTNPTIRKTKPNMDGSYNVKISISTCGKTIYYATRFKIDSISQWQNGRVIRRPDAALINAKLREMAAKIAAIIDESPETRVMTIPQLRQFVERNLDRTESFVEFGDRYIAELLSNKQHSYAQNMGYTIRAIVACFGELVQLRDFSLWSIEHFEKYLRKHGCSDTTINIRMSHLKTLLNAAVNCGYVEYKVFPFRGYRMPPKAIRDICISREELALLRDTHFDSRPLETARDLFMLSFYCAGINMTDLLSAKFDKDVLTFVRKKTATRKHGANKEVSITIQPEARAIIDKYVNKEGMLDMGYRYSDYKQFRSYITKKLSAMGKRLDFEKPLMFYSARKTFCQFGFEIGVPLFVLEYAIGQTIKDANNRPIFNYIKIMRSQADTAIRSIIDYSFGLGDASSA